MRNKEVVLVSSRHPVLYQSSEDAVIGSEESEQIIAKLQQYMKENETCQGVSANQIGIPKRVAVCRYKGEIYILQNPEVEWRFGVKRSLERCLSAKGCFFVKRPLICKVTWYNTDGLQINKIMLYKKARVFLHEIDHLNGICINNAGSYWKYSNTAEQYMAKKKEKTHVKSIRNTSKI